MPLNEIIVWVAKLDTITISWNVWSYTFRVWCSHLSYSASLLTSLSETAQVEVCVSVPRDSERTHLFPSSLSLEREGPLMSTPLYSYWALKRTQNCISRSASSPLLRLWQRYCGDTSNYTLKSRSDFFGYFYFGHETPDPTFTAALGDRWSVKVWIHYYCLIFYCCEPLHLPCQRTDHNPEYPLFSASGPEHAETQRLHGETPHPTQSNPTLFIEHI